MILIVSSNARERAALSALCESRRLTANTCESLRQFRHALERCHPSVVLARHRLSDGYSDDILAALSVASPRSTKVIVLAQAEAASMHEARQLALGADCVLRDPVRPEVLLEYVAKYQSDKSSINPRRGRERKPLRVGTATLDPVERTLKNRRGAALLTPREVTLARQLIESRGQVLSYDDLFEGVLGRRFNGDTSNMRVLLGKLCTSAESIGVQLREWIQVIPKTGYRYRNPLSRIS